MPWLKAVRDHPDRPPPVQRHVLTCLVLRLNWGTGSGYVSARQLAADAGCDERTVRRATRWARRAGLLVMTRRGHRIRGGTATASEWRLCHGADRPGVSPTGQGRPLGGDPTGQGRPVRGDPTGQRAGTQPDSTTPPSHPVSITPCLSPASDIIRSAFPDATDDEIEQIRAEVKTRPGVRSVGAYLGAMAANGDLRLPCDPGPDSPTDCCRQRDGHGNCHGQHCRLDWCSCRCHTKPKTSQEAHP